MGKLWRMAGRAARMNRKLVVLTMLTIIAATITIYVYQLRLPPAATPGTADTFINSPLLQPAIALAATADCKPSGKARAGLGQSTVPQIKKLAQYEQVCGGQISSRLSHFTNIPIDTNQAASYSNEMVGVLREFAKYGLSPVIFFEPTGSDSKPIDMNKYRSGAYDAAIKKYFENIKKAGVTDAMMGLWVPLPEGNTPVWSSVDPNVFAVCVTRTVKIQKQYFPKSRAAIMLDSLTYPSASNWEGAKYTSLTPYTKGIPAGLLDSFGLQGFPWLPAANSGQESGNGTPSNYLQADRAAEAAQSLGVKEVWFNTGTFGTKYTNDNSQTITVSPDKRLVILNQTIAEARKLQQQGYKTAIHLFAENKSASNEATDWSYWPGGNTQTTPTITAFKTFVGSLKNTGIELWLFG